MTDLNYRRLEWTIAKGVCGGILLFFFIWFIVGAICLLIAYLNGALHDGEGWELTF